MDVAAHTVACQRAQELAEATGRPGPIALRPVDEAAARLAVAVARFDAAAELARAVGGGGGEV